MPGSYPKIDSFAKAAGDTVFADDIVLPGMLHAKLLRATIAFGRVKHIDFSDAARIPGVKGFLTSKDLPVPYGILPSSQDEYALSDGTVRHAGEAIAAVLAVDELTCEDALEKIRVEYEKYVPVMDIESALSDKYRKLHDGQAPANIHKIVGLEFGKPDVSAYYEREDTFFYQGSTHLPMEQHSCVAVYSANDRLTLYSSTQTPHYVHRALAKVLGLPESRIRVVAAPVGGGFGGKSDPFPHEMVAAKFAMLYRKPVKITLTREEVFYAHRGRHPVLMKIRTKWDKSLKSIKSMKFTSILDGGAYGSYGVASTYYTGALQTVTYAVDNYRFTGVRVYTNKPPCGPKRGHGTPQPRFALEVHLDKVAEEMKLDPAELRRKIMLKDNTTTANWLRVTTISLRECLDKVVSASGWKAKFGRLPYGKGIGLACSSYLSGAGLPIYWNPLPHSAVQLRADRSGLVTIYCGAIDIGQGSDNVITEIVCKTLGLDPLRDTSLVTADTDLTPVDLGSYSSRVTLMCGNAAIEAARKLKQLIAEAVAAEFGCDASDVAFANGRVSGGGKSASFKEAVLLAEKRHGALCVSGSYSPPPSLGKYKGAGVGPSPCYSYTACVAEVSVEPETGRVRPEKIWIAHDIGKAINETLAIGQVEGGVYMGLGEALMEEQVFRKGVHKIPSMLDYKSPTSLEMPEVETFLIERPDSRGPFGGKEVGQGPLLPVPPAIANAVYNAVGVRVDELPITPEKVLKGIKLKRAGKDARVGPESFPIVPPHKVLKVKTPDQGGDGTSEIEEEYVHRGPERC